jgi:hypothetical protein
MKARIFEAARAVYADVQQEGAWNDHWPDYTTEKDILGINSFIK